MEEERNEGEKKRARGIKKKITAEIA